MEGPKGFTSGFGSRNRHSGENIGLTREEVMEKKNWRQYQECKLCGGWFYMKKGKRYCIWCEREILERKKPAVQKSIENYGSVAK